MCIRDRYGGLELAYKIVTNDTYPSWGYMIKKGATTIWELWNGDTANPEVYKRQQGGFLVLAVGIQRRREINGLGYQLLIQIVYRMLGACQITVGLVILGRHHQRQCCRRRATTAGIHDREIILELAREAAVLLIF